ncbi:MULTISPECIES: Sir2 family NAD+-dependent deacetylase [unclassified Gilliamella]|jgi:NAD-dependent deacetylase|uniref:Sir2 family NAD+-dependent deacetylase n=1 Tax=unclassified Gilliamella TaxID=2685620 RepID=UPI00046171AD|nr:Sir2 family NAD+-dependent deacetylase [Gilliamella apicola]KDN09924.1 NAD-dependent protein deacetylase of SIR2 family [Gilliamella apicola]OCG41105.1 NAD-dependent protein deacylase [Gilliamella apicola]OCG57264.1 NAD-dependent protein deacylase [Gilliamella apicola]OCG59427.1 NAD-dependent protein deacylase [Gilliamella apicola]OCG79522.1 NAD-dependent protein deacylase [Gilliamella apicola]
MKIPKIVILTGAGISAESGLSTFRAQNGLWEGYDVNDVATYEGYIRNPTAVHDFYNMLRRKLQNPDVKPNAAHFALAELEQKLGSDNLLIVTQNVDNLHEQAGSKNIIHMHGELLKVRNEKTGQIIDCFNDVNYQQNKFIRPHIVWFGEIPLQMEQIYDALSQADYFISIGTSGNVYPAAGFVQIANQTSAKTVELNLEPSLGESLFQTKIYGPASKIVPEFIKKFI